ALLTSIQDNKDKVAAFVNECRRLKIKVLPPDVNSSGSDFTAVGQTIRFGLSAVRNVGSAAIKAIIEGRNKKGKFASITDFCERVDLSVINKRCMESLIKAGAFDYLNYKRGGLLLVFEQIMERGDRRQKDVEKGQFSLFDDQNDEKDSFFAESVPDKQLDKGQMLAYEKEMLGLYVSGHPLKGLENELRQNSDISLLELREEKDGSVKSVAGMISHIRMITTKKGDLMAFVELEDMGASLEVIVFPSLFKKHKDLLDEDKIISVKGRLDKKENESKLIAMELNDIKNGNKKVQSVNVEKILLIRINSSHCSQANINRLKDILRSNPGQMPVFVELAENDSLTRIKIGPDFKVSKHNRLISELKELLGSDSIIEKEVKQAASV
ncbi:MAG: DNA polymerase III subunit alpha, partial [Actinobacteria bacterium]